MPRRARRDIPAMFTGPLIRQIYAGKKWKTRRVVRGAGQEWLRYFDCGKAQDAVVLFCNSGHSGPGWYVWCGSYPEDGSFFLGTPWGVPGDRLWVRETWQTWAERAGSHQCVVFRADGRARELLADGGGEGEPVGLGRWVTPSRSGPQVWRPSLLMPRWASRLQLEVLSVGLERLQEISEAEAIAEGICDSDDTGLCRAAVEAGDHRSAYAHVWDAINGHRPGARWKDNPWVWNIGFRRVGARRAG